MRQAIYRPRKDEGGLEFIIKGSCAPRVGLPVLAALPLLRYVRGRGASVMLVLLLGVKASLPVWSGKERL